MGNAKIVTTDRNNGSEPRETPRAQNPRKEGSAGRGHEIKIEYSKVSNTK